MTWVNSTTNVRLRILGDSYSALFDELATNMELHYFEAEKAKKVERPVVGKLYAAKVEGKVAPTLCYPNYDNTLQNADLNRTTTNPVDVCHV